MVQRHYRRPQVIARSSSAWCFYVQLQPKEVKKHNTLAGRTNAVEPFFHRFGASIIPVCVIELTYHRVVVKNRLFCGHSYLKRRFVNSADCLILVIPHSFGNPILESTDLTCITEPLFTVAFSGRRARTLWMLVGPRYCHLNKS
jgi:hypothetical protein